jgi:hypothetical protein
VKFSDVFQIRINTLTNLVSMIMKKQLQLSVVMTVFSSLLFAQASPSKKATLEKVIGEHHLISISGFSGMNTMFDYAKEAGKWTGSMSALSEGQREGMEMEFNQQELKELNGTKVVVQPDLSITIECNGKIYYKIPFVESGMDCNYTSTSDLLAGLSTSTVFKDNQLYLIARDGQSDEQLELSMLAGSIADALILKLDPQSGSFILSLFQSDCCDQATYTFD